MSKIRMPNVVQVAKLVNEASREYCFYNLLKNHNWLTNKRFLIRVTDDYKEKILAHMTHDAGKKQADLKTISKVLNCEKVISTYCWCLEMTDDYSTSKMFKSDCEIFTYMFGGTPNIYRFNGSVIHWISSLHIDCTMKGHVSKYSHELFWMHKSDVVAVLSGFSD